jgi:predicted GIY-YIG superfamily endonuclease
MVVYLLRSLSNPAKTYIGRTVNFHGRLTEHNSGKSAHARRFGPWELVTSIFFSDPKRARDFESYLKHGSGHAFAKHHFW